MTEVGAKKTKGKTKCKMVSMRMTLEQYTMIDFLAKEIKRTSGFHITKASIMLKMMEYGYPQLKSELEAEDLQKFKKRAG